MPELPEVETVRCGLEKKIVGLTIKNLQVLNLKSVQFGPELVEGRKVLGVWRRAKILGIDLSGNQTLLFHLKMTGQLILESRVPPGARLAFGGKSLESRLIGGHPTPDMQNQMPIKSTVAIFEFSNGSNLYFNDQRKFGWVKAISNQQSAVSQLLGNLGPEPLEKDFTWEILKSNLLNHKSQPVKVALMDQSLIAGVGNIYASESLFLAKIDPRRKVSTLSDSEFKKLHQGVVESLETAIKAGGSTRAHFVNIDGERGYFLDYANVYGKEGYFCKAGCGGKVEKITQAGRGTYFCPNCQK